MTEKDENLPLEFNLKLSAAKLVVSGARASGSQFALAQALKELGNIQRRLPQLRKDSNRTFAEAAALYQELGMPLEAAWVIRHIGINQEYAELLSDAENYYDESLALFRQYADDDDGNYANTVRYPAVIKNRVGKRDESRALWEEAVRRYADMNQPAGVAEGAAWLTIFAIERSDLKEARKWFSDAVKAARAANDRDTYTFIDEVKAKLTQAEDS